jgi:UDP-N-acetylglucosamine 2-epimerase
LGEDPAHIHVVGAPGLDDLPVFDEPRTDEILVCMHPVSTREEEQNRVAIGSVAEAVKGRKVFWLMPNDDPGGIQMRNMGESLGAVKRLPRREYLRKLATCACAVGNSSSFLIEAPFYGTPVVLVGERQAGRELAGCVHPWPWDNETLPEAIARVQRPEFMEYAAKFVTPYGPGASERIVKILEDLDLSTLDMQKSWHD